MMLAQCMYQNTKLIKPFKLKSFSGVPISKAHVSLLSQKKGLIAEKEKEPHLELHVESTGLANKEKPCAVFIS